jgi:hypothetical protein
MMSLVTTISCITRPSTPVMGVKSGRTASSRVLELPECGLDWLVVEDMAVMMKIYERSEDYSDGWVTVVGYEEQKSELNRIPDVAIRA